MSSPIVNLRKTTLPPEKIIFTPETEINSYNGKNHRKSIEEEMEELKKNTVIKKKKMVEEMYQRMSDLENQVKDIKEQLRTAIAVINRKDEEIEMLKEQLLQVGRNQSKPHLYSANEAVLKDNYLKEQHDILNESINNMVPRKTFNRKGDVISIKDGKCGYRTKRCDSKDECESQRGELEDYPTFEILSQGHTVRGKDKSRNKKQKKVYKVETNELEEGCLDMDEMLSDNMEDYIDNLSSRNSIGSSHSKISSNLQRENSRLATQIDDMEKFLSDYGMIWVGEKTVTDRVHGNITLQAAVGFTPDFDKLIVTIGELNQRASSEKHIRVTGNEAKFQEADMLNLTLYSDGMQLEDAPFRSFSAGSVQAFFQDLGDGYYPTELKESHPEGVIFKVIDKRSNKYTEAKNGVVPYGGQGYVLGTRDPPNGEQSLLVGQRQELSNHQHNLSDQQKEQSCYQQQLTDHQKESLGNLQELPFHQKKPSGHRQELTDYQKEPIDNQQEYTQQSMENRGTQTEMCHEEVGGNMQMKNSSWYTQKYEQPIEQFRDKIEITNITYHEAPSANVDLVRRIVIGTVESQSEPVLTSSSALSPQRSRQSSRIHKDQARQSFKVRERAPRTSQSNINDEATSQGSEDSEKGSSPIFNSEYNNSFGRNANKDKEMIANKNAKDSISQQNFDLLKHYEHMTLLGQDVVSQEKVVKEGKENKKSLDDYKLHTVKSVENDPESDMIHLNQRTSDEQIKLLMLPDIGKKIYCVYVSPDDSIEKIWHFMKFSPVDFDVTTVDGKVLDMSVPLKNYNIDGDVTLKIIRKKPVHKMGAESRQPSLDEDSANDSLDEDEDAPQISEPFDKDGYSS